MRLAAPPALCRAAARAAFARPQRLRRAAAAARAPRASGASAAPPARLAGEASLAAHLHTHAVRAMILPAAEAGAQEAAAPADAVRFSRTCYSLCVTRWSQPAISTQVLKTLVFSAGDGVDAPLVVVVLPLTARVDTRKLARALGLRRSALRLAPPAAAEAATGYSCGDIPPLGHVQRLRVLLDAAALAGGPTRPLYAGGGGGGASLRIPAAELLRATAAEVADVAAGRSPADVAALLSAVAASFGPPHESLLGAYVGASCDASASAQAAAADVAEALLASAAPAVVDATVGRVRRMGRLLLFASLLQPAWHRGGDDVAEQDALQALAGRTFASAFDSEDSAAEALRAIMRPGARVRVAGRLQANPRPGCVDVVVAEMRLIATEAPAHAVPPAAVPDSAITADAKDPDAWFLEAGGYDDADEEGEEEDYDEELLEEGDSDDSDTEDALPLSNDPRGSRPRRRSARRRSAHRATELAPLRPFTLPAGVAVAYVDCASDVASMAALLLDPASATHAPLDGIDDVALPAAVGLDSEWRPYARGEAATPVALLQLCSRRHAFLVDVQALAADSDSAGMAALGAFMRALLASPAVIKTGLGLRHDLTRLAESHASLGLGGAPARGLLELRAAAATAAPEALPWLPRPARLLMAGLASLARLALRCELDKGAQVSDWAARPLNETQRAYAAADAVALLALLDSLLRRSAALRSRLPALLDAPPAGLPRRGRQEDHANRREPRAARGTSSSSSRGDKLSPRAVQIDAEPLLRAFLGAPLPAKGRDAALAAAAGAGAGGRARGAGGCRGGVLECANATLLFMNAEPVFGKRYPNTFWRRGSYSGDSDDSLMMSWFGNPGQSRDAPQVAHLRAPGATVLLFARLPRGPYVLCGRLACEGTSEDGDDGDDPALPPAPTGLLRLSMRLLDAGPLCGSAHFAALLQHAQGDAGLALLRR